MNETIELYLDFLWKQFQHDWSIFTHPWVLYTVIPALLYSVFFWIKWLILLAPITVPLSLLRKSDDDDTEYRDKLTTILSKDDSK
jgi:hypothetical protein